MTADLVARLEAWAGNWPSVYATDRQNIALLREAASALRSSGEAIGERRAPVQGYGEGTIPWSIHCLAWEAYAKKYGRQQTAERLAQRGGFGVEEMDMFLPGWRGMAHAIDHPATPASAWRPIAEAALLTRNAVGVSGPCAVLLRIDTGRPGPFIRQGRFDAAAGAFVCDSTGQVLRDAIAFVEPEFPTSPTSTKGG